MKDACPYRMLAMHQLQWRRQAWAGASPHPSPPPESPRKKLVCTAVTLVCYWQMMMLPDATSNFQSSKTVMLKVIIHT